MSSDETIAAQFNTEVLNKINSAATHIELFYHGKEMSFAKDELPLVMGRDEETCQVVVKTDVASRNHCTLEVQDNQIGILDQSTNGTFIKIGRADSFSIKGKFYPLVGQGHIKLGGPIDLDDTDNIIFYRTVNKTLQKKAK